MIKYFKRTWKNKVAALCLMGAGYVSTFAGDATAFVVLCMFAIPLFFIRENCMK